MSGDVLLATKDQLRDFTERILSAYRAVNDESLFINRFSSPTPYNHVGFRIAPNHAYLMIQSWSSIH